MVYQLPAVAFPESLPVNDMEDYELMRPYLHSTDLKWTYGGLKGRPKGDWAEVASQTPTDRLLVELAAAGFGGIHIDRFGYPAHDTSVLEGDITRLTGAKPLESPDERFAFFDLSDYVAEVEGEHSQKWLDEVGDHLVNPPMYYWQQGFNQPFVDPAGPVVLPGKGPAIGLDLLSQRPDDTPVRVMFTVRADGATGPTPVRITWPDGEVEDVTVGVEGLDVDRKLDLAPGASEIGFSASGVASISLINTVVKDPVLAFPLDPSDDEKAGSRGQGTATVSDNVAAVTDPIGTRARSHRLRRDPRLSRGHHPRGCRHRAGALLRLRADPDGHLLTVTEVLLVHDNGPDDSAGVIRELAEQYDHVRAVWLSRNFGQHAATLAGMASSGGDWIVTMDEDGQHDPAAIGPMLDVAMRRAGRRGLRATRPTSRRTARCATSRRGPPSGSSTGCRRGRVGGVPQLPAVLGEVGRSVARLRRGRRLPRRRDELGRRRVATCPVELRDEGGRPSGYSTRTLAVALLADGAVQRHPAACGWSALLGRDLRPARRCCSRSSS